MPSGGGTGGLCTQIKHVHAGYGGLNAHRGAHSRTLVNTGNRAGLREMHVTSKTGSPLTRRQWLLGRGIKDWITTRPAFTEPLSNRTLYTTHAP